MSGSAETGTPHPTEISVADALRIAVDLHRQGRLDEASELYGRILEADPECVDALHFLGLISYQRGEADRAVALLRQALDLRPSYGDAWNNLGNVLKMERRLSEAEESFRRAIAISPDSADAHNNLCIVLKDQDRLEEAESAGRSALRLDAGHVEAHINLGNLLARMGRSEAALDCFKRALELRPGFGPAHKRLGMLYYQEGRLEDAAKVFRDWRRNQPDDAVAEHMAAAMTGVGVPDRASDNYVRQHFDEFADEFDTRLASLDYAAPGLIAKAMAGAWVRSDRPTAVVDAGCGTGLCGPLLRPYTERLVGVDLSSRILEFARKLGVYDHLETAELTRYLNESRHAFDVVVAADTLIYFGKLEPMFAAAGNALKPGGLLVFTAEALSEGDAGFKLNPSGRYSHRRRYIEDALRTTGMETREFSEVTLRTERRTQVGGYLVVAVKPGTMALGLNKQQGTA